MIENSKLGPGGPLRVYSDGKDRVTPGSFIPYCSMAQAQLSFHGHRDAVKFFVSVPGHGGLSLTSGASDSGSSSSDMKSSRVESMLVMSGGEGYIDFRIGDTESETGSDPMSGGGELGGEGREASQGLSKGERSHLVVWQVTLPPGPPKPPGLF